ncbi:MAG: hypothetical protein LBF28_00395, partial [Rickettsiales bacterium]|nr:hypothetical protein [Rickettsiales bacterium]
TTARFAIEYGRFVHASPSHPSDARAAGPNSLIKEGLATLCSGEKDFFDVACPSSEKHSCNKKNDSENALLDKLGIIPLSESVLAELVKKNIAEIKKNLVVLELQGLVAKTDGGYIKI